MVSVQFQIYGIGDIYIYMDYFLSVARKIIDIERNKIKKFFSTAFLFVGVIFSGFQPAHAFDDFINYKASRGSQSIGYTGAACLIQSNILLVDSKFESKIQTIANKIVKAAECKIPCKIHIINSPMVNLLSLPSGDVFVFSGFLDVIDNADELAFALSHEIAHINLEHGLNQMKRGIQIQRNVSLAAAVIENLIQAAINSAFKGAMMQISIGTFQEVFNQSVIVPVGRISAQISGKISEALAEYIIVASLHLYSQDQELQADRLGMIYMQKAGFDPRAAIETIKKLPRHGE